MRKALLILLGASLAACASEVPPQVDAEAVEAAVEHARLEMERATAPSANAASEKAR